MASRGRPKDDAGPYNLKALCRIDTLKSLKVIQSIRDDDQAPPASRLKASEMLLDRAWGKPTQTVEMMVDDNRAPSELSRNELADRAASIIASGRTRTN